MLARHPSSLLCSGYSGLQASYLTLFTIAGMTGTCHHAQLFSTEMESHKHFCLGLPGTSVILISAPQVAEISHDLPAPSFKIKVFKDKLSDGALAYQHV
jgi:hypothetical protein